MDAPVLRWTFCQTCLRQHFRNSGILVSESSEVTSCSYSRTTTGLRTSFTLVSNFLMLLLVQAPDFGKAVRAKHLLAKWRR